MVSNVTPIKQNKVTLLEAIAREEGWLLVNSRARRNHNPGNINWGKFAQMHGALRIEREPQFEYESNFVPRFAYFPNDLVGFQAMSALIEATDLGKSLYHAIYRWAPPTENNTQAYLNNICKWTGLEPNIILTVENLQIPTNFNQNGNQLEFA